MPRNALLQSQDAALEGGTVLDAQGGRARGVLAEGVDADGQGSLGSEHAADLAAQLDGRRADELGVVDEAVLGRVVARLERAEQGLLGSEDLDSGRRVFGQV